MKKFTLLKKARKYYHATTGGYKCKILIDENSQDLEMGEHELEVEDISVRTKYGTDLIFKLTASLQEQEEAGICTLVHPRYNSDLHGQCKGLGGKWDGEAEAWVFSALVEDKVEELDALYNSEPIPCEVTYVDDVAAERESVYLYGYRIAKASGRDSGAVLGDGVSLIAGRVTSGGSRANWDTIVPEGTVIRLYIPRGILEQQDITINPDGLTPISVPEE